MHLLPACRFEISEFAIVASFVASIPLHLMIFANDICLVKYLMIFANNICLVKYLMKNLELKSYQRPLNLKSGIINKLNLSILDMSNAVEKYKLS